MTSEWTHPEHWRVALFGTLLNVTSLILCMLAFMGITWFSSDRLPNVAMEYTLMDMNVDCFGDICTRSNGGSVAEWQKSAFNLIVAGIVDNLFTAFVLVFVFWPVVAIKNKVLNGLLIVCRLLDFVGAYFKVVAVCIYLSHSHDISKNYVKRTTQFILRLEFLPICLVLLSFIAEILSFVFLLVATDNAPRTGGLTYLERLVQEIPSKEPEMEMEPERRVSYFPDSKESHMRVLSQLQVGKSTSKFDGTIL